MLSCLIFYHIIQRFTKKSTPLNDFRQLWFTKFYILWHILSEGVSILFFCLFVKNNSWGNSSTWTFFLVILNVVPVLYFAADFNLLSSVFASLTVEKLPSFIRLLRVLEKTLVSFLWFFLKLLRQTWIY